MMSVGRRPKLHVIVLLSMLCQSVRTRPERNLHTIIPMSFEPADNRRLTVVYHSVNLEINRSVNRGSCA